MCGIIGAVSSSPSGFTRDECKALYELLTVDQVRGYDGTGILGTNYKDNSVWYVKEATTPHEALSGRETGMHMISQWNSCIGHNRAATLGKINQDNTHPFVYDNVVGVHNGTINAWRSLFPRTKASMDSMALYEAMDNKEEKDTADFLKGINSGAYALAWIDRRSTTLKLVRNKERPMYIVTTSTAIFFGSEIKMLEWILDRNNITVKESIKLKVHTVVGVPVGRKGLVEAEEYKPRSYSYSYTGGQSRNAGWFGGGYEYANPIGRPYSSTAKPTIEKWSIGTFDYQVSTDIAKRLNTASVETLGFGVGDRTSPYFSLSAALNEKRKQHSIIGLGGINGQSRRIGCKVILASKGKTGPLYYGCILRGGKQPLPVSMRVLDVRLEKRIDAILNKNKLAELHAVHVNSVVFTHTGICTLGFSPLRAVDLSPEDVTQYNGKHHNKWSEHTEKAIRTVYGADNPIKKAESGRINWSAGWKAA